MKSGNTDISRSLTIVQKVRQAFTWENTEIQGIQAQMGLALFYAWNIFEIYLGNSSYSPQPIHPHISFAITSALTTAIFLLIALIGVSPERFRRVYHILGRLVLPIVAVLYVVILALIHLGLLGGAASIHFSCELLIRAISAFIVIGWGALFSTLDIFEITRSTLAAFFLGLLICVCFLVIPSPFAQMGAPFLLVCSVVLFESCQTNRSSIFDSTATHPKPQPTHEAHRAFFRMTKKIILIFFLLGIVTWTGIIRTFDQGFSTHPSSALVIIGSLLVVGVLYIATTYNQSTFSSSYIYKIVIPLIMLGVLSFDVLGIDFNLGASFIFIGYTCFDLFCFTLFATAVNKTHSHAISMFGICRAIESCVPLVVVGLMSGMSMFTHSSSQTMYPLIGPVCIIVGFATLLLSETRLFERKAVSLPNYPKAEVLTFAEQCEYAIKQYGLSDREAEVLSLIVRGRSVPHISERLYISKSTVKTHITHIYQKFGVTERQEMLDLIESIDLKESTHEA